MTGQFDATYHKAVWPSTGNYCRGGAFNSKLLACDCVAILPAEMSRERFEWLSKIAGEVIATPGCESNVKEIFDKTWELKQQPEMMIFNQFEEMGNPLWHYNVTGAALADLFEAVKRPGDNFSGACFTSGSAGTMIFGANVISVKGNYEETFKMSAEAIDKYGWYNRNAAINPYLSEGKKTVALEIAEQLNWQVPDYVAISVGDGCTIAGVWKGFKDLYALGFIDRLPKLLSAQSTGCCPLNRAIQTGEAWYPMEENTIADSISVGVPRNADKALMPCTSETLTSRPLPRSSRPSSLLASSVPCPPTPTIMTPGPLTISSPTSPRGTSLPVSSTIFAFQP